MVDTEESKKVKEKRKLLREIHNKCMTEHKAYKKRYRILKKYDDLVDVAHTTLNMSAVALTISGFGLPPLLIASASCAGLGLILTQAQKTYNSKVRLTNYSVCVAQYDELGREITATLFRNHMQSEDYQEFIENVHQKLSMIDDSKLI